MKERVGGVTVCDKTDLKISNWVRNDPAKMKEEYAREFCRYYPNSLTYHEFVEKCNAGKFVVIEPSDNPSIGNMTRIPTVEGVLSLIKGYRSYPEFRNEKTLAALYKMISTHAFVDMPLFVRKNGKITVIGGNTRANLAYIAGVTCVGQLIDLG